MKKFCIKRWHDREEIYDNIENYIFSKNDERCDGCGECKRAEAAARKEYWIYKLHIFIIPFAFICKIIYYFFRILFLPYLIYKYEKEGLFSTDTDNKKDLSD